MKDPEKVNARARKYRALHPERCKASYDAWRIRNRDKLNADRKEWDRRRSQMLADYKMAKGCALCGYKGHPHALEFDHLPEFVKRANVSTMKSYSLDVLWQEIEKCRIVCANCHAIETENRRQAMREAKRKDKAENQLKLFA